MIWFAHQDFQLWHAAQKAGITHVPIALGRPNMGDDIQTLAALRWLDLPSTAVVSRDHPEAWPAGAKVLLCGWYARVPLVPDNVDTHICGLHISARAASHDAREGRFENLRHRVRQMDLPAGCRDLHTESLLRSHRIPTRWSGCPTQTLDHPERPPRRTHLLAIDALPPSADYRAFTHRQPPGIEAEERLQRAASALQMLATCSSLHTTRLHAALPALALGCGDVHISQDPATLTNPERWSGFSHLYHSKL